MNVAVSIIDELVVAQPHNDKWRLEQAQAHTKLGDIAGTLLKLDEARAEYEGALAIAQQLAVRQPDDAAVQRTLASDNHNLCSLLLLAKGDRVKSKPYCDAAVSLAEAFLAKHPEDAELRGALREWRTLAQN